VTAFFIVSRVDGKEETMSKAKTIFLVVGLIIAVVSTSCSFGPPPSCGDAIGGMADEDLFSIYFSDMTLRNQNTGEAGTPGENGPEFSKTDILEIQYQAIAGTELRACVQPRGAGTLPFDQTREIPAGSGTFTLDTFDPGNYVIRVIVDDTLIKNLTFHIQ
jgi:hypothetical protein